MDKYPPLHPGQFLYLEFMQPLGLSQYKLAQALAVPKIRISEIVRGKRGISVDTAMRLGIYFGTSTEYWTNLQTHYEVEIAEDALGAKIRQTVKPHPQPLTAMV